MPRDLSTISIENITFEDIEAQIGAEESIRLEFKRTLSTTDGRQDRWIVDQSRIGANARDDIAKEIVAFANAYGGVLIVGIEETSDNPRRAAEIFSPQIPRAADCADQLASALRSVIDPPLPMLEVRGICETGDTGVLFLRVGASASAPHGIGRPPLAYVRRGSSSEPLTMRDLHSMFFERRTRLERVEQQRQEQAQAAKEIAARWYKDQLKKFDDSAPFGAETPGLLFRCSLIPSEDMGIDNFPDRFIGIRNQLTPRPAISGHEIIELPQWGTHWQRRYRSVECAGGVGDYRLWWAKISAAGLINLTSVSTVRSGQAVLLNRYAETILQAMILAEWIRRWASRPDVEYILDGNFICRGSPAVRVDQREFPDSRAIPWRESSIGPYSITQRDGFARTFDVIEREIWDLFGLPRQTPLQFDLSEIFRSVGL